ncbi:hypothetical protein L9F63_008484, partial [Diploptera punctata]
FRECKTFKRDVVIQDEYLHVTCRVNGEKIFKQYYAFVPNKPKIWNSQNIAEHTNTSYNLLLVGMDAVSRLNFHRQLPNTINTLNNLGMIELLGYNKVADEKFPNLVPLLTGQSTSELKKTCWLNNYETLDSCPWIWKNFHNSGFISGYGEDAADLSMFFYHNEGLSQKPTDYDITPFMKQADEDTGHKNTYVANLCLGNHMCLETLFDYISKFANSFKNYRKFGFFWSNSLTHDNLNYASLADNSYVRLIRQLDSSEVLTNTILILLSDHGLRNSKITEVNQGYLEDKLPHVFFIFPKTFEKMYPLAINNLKSNTHRLTTAFDIHKTLLDLTNPELKIDNQILRQRRFELQRENSTRAISLFLRVPESRTCKDAEIGLHYCTCLISKSISPTGKLVQDIGNGLVQYINSLLKKYTECSLLTLVEVRTARIEYSLVQWYEKTKEKYRSHYVVSVLTAPGNGLFEGIIAQTSNKGTYHIIGNVTRINTYGSENTCIDDYDIKYFCYCEDLIS